VGVVIAALASVPEVVRPAVPELEFTVELVVSIWFVAPPTLRSRLDDDGLFRVVISALDPLSEGLADPMRCAPLRPQPTSATMHAAVNKYFFIIMSFAFAGQTGTGLLRHTQSIRTRKRQCDFREWGWGGAPKCF